MAHTRSTMTDWIVKWVSKCNLFCNPYSVYILDTNRLLRTHNKKKIQESLSQFPNTQSEMYGVQTAIFISDQNIALAYVVHTVPAP